MDEEKTDRIFKLAIAVGTVAAIAYLIGRKHGAGATWKQFETGWLVTSATPTTVKGGEMLRVEFRNGAHQFLQPRS